jgi:Protein of unknown function (DUF3072)
MTGAQAPSYLATLGHDTGRQIDETVTKAEALKLVEELQAGTGRVIADSAQGSGWLRNRTPECDLTYRFRGGVSPWTEPSEEERPGFEPGRL